MLTPLGRQVPAAVVRRWCRWIVRAAGVRVRVTGAAAPAGGLLLVANHVSWLDIPLLAVVRPARMLAKSEIRRWPVAGPLAARGGVPVHRAEPAAGPAGHGRRARAGPARGCRRRRLSRGQHLGADALRGPSAGPSSRPPWTPGCPFQPVRIRYRAGERSVSTAPAFVGEDTLLASLWRGGVGARADRGGGGTAGHRTGRPRRPPLARPRRPGESTFEKYVAFVTYDPFSYL